MGASVPGRLSFFFIWVCCLGEANPTDEPPGKPRIEQQKASFGDDARMKIGSVPTTAPATSEVPGILSNAPAPELDGEHSAGVTSSPEKASVPGGGTTSMMSSNQTFPPLPYLYDVGPAWLFFGLQAIGGNNPPDFLPDPAIRFLNQGPASLVITRYTNGPFGPWDQVAFTPGFVNLVGTNVSTSRTTQGYTSSPLPAAYNFPTHVPAKYARFEWIQRSDGLEDLNVYAPPNASTPSAWVKGLWKLPNLAIPIPNTTYFIPTVLFDELVSVVDGFGADGSPNITGHLLTHFDIQGSGSLGGFLSYGAVEGGMSQGGYLACGHLFE